MRFCSTFFFLLFITLCLCHWSLLMVLQVMFTSNGRAATPLQALRVQYMSTIAPFAFIRWGSGWGFKTFLILGSCLKEHSSYISIFKVEVIFSYFWLLTRILGINLLPFKCICLYVLTLTEQPFVICVGSFKTLNTVQ